MTTIKAVFFDIEGTLANTSPDLANSLNQLLKKHNKSILPFEKIRSLVLNGGETLITRGFHIHHTHPEFESLKNEFLDIYQENIAAKTTLFPGIAKVLSELETQNIKWGIVTNKPSWLTDVLLDALNLKSRACCIVSGDSLHVKKPNPIPLLAACHEVDSQVQECIYVGATERGILAGSRAEMRTAVTLFGDINESNDPQNWGADRMIKSPLDILLWINTINKITPLRNKEVVIARPKYCLKTI